MESAGEFSRLSYGVASRWVDTPDIKYSELYSLNQFIARRLRLKGRVSLTSAVRGN